MSLKNALKTRNVIKTFNLLKLISYYPFKQSYLSLYDHYYSILKFRGYPMKHAKFIFILILAICCSGLASAQLPYYVDSNGNTWINVSTTGTAPQYYTVSSTGGPAPSGTSTFPMFDDFSQDGGVLNSNLWTTTYEGTGSGTAVFNGSSYVINGQPLTASSMNLLSTYQFTNGSELILNESRSNDFYSDVSFGSGSLVQAGGWYHTMFGTNGGSFITQGWTAGMGYRDSSAPGSGTATTYLYGTGSPSAAGLSLNQSFTMGYSYNYIGNASVNVYTSSYPNTTVNRTQTVEYDVYGYNQNMHPDVYFNNSSTFISVYKHPYWMLCTDYYVSVDTVEQPQLICSDDGLTWICPTNVTNPIAPQPNNTYYHDDDTDMVYNTTSGKLECYYLVTQRTPYNATLQQRTFDGVTVSNYVNCTGESPFLVSNALIRNDDGTYDMWAVNLTNVPKAIYHYTSTDGMNWANEQNISFTPVSGKDIWHFNVQKYNGKYLYMMTYCDYGTSGGNAKLYIGSSDTPTGAITVQADKPLVDIESAGSFDDREIYRSCSLTDGNGIDIWISGDNQAQKWFTALTYATQNSTGYWSLQHLYSSPLYMSYYNSIPVYRCLMSQEAHGAETHLTGLKSWDINQGVYTTAGHGANRTINTAWVRNTRGRDSAIAFSTVGSQSILSITPTVSGVYAQIEIPAGLLVASNTMDIEPMAAPTAAFTSSNTSNVFTFTDTSLGNPTSWLWNFGDGQTSTVQNPTHTYMANGTYTVSLTATNLAGSNQITHSAVVFVPIAHAGFTQTNNSNVFTFTDISTNNPTSWLWNFGDGQTSTLQNPTHTYTANGTYTVTLNASNVYGYTIAVTSVQVTLPPVPTAKSMAFDSVVPLFALFGILPFILVVGAILIGVRTKNYNIMFTMCGIAVVVFLIIVFGLVVLSAFNNV